MIIFSTSNNIYSGVTEDDFFWCYACSYVQGQENARPCVDEPWNFTLTNNKVNCSGGQVCYSNSITNLGKLSSFSELIRLNRVILHFRD